MRHVLSFNLFLLQRWRLEEAGREANRTPLPNMAESGRAHIWPKKIEAWPGKKPFGDDLICCARTVTQHSSESCPPRIAIMFFTIFLSLVAIAVAAEPCKFPKQWSGGADNENYVRGGSFDSFEIAYDADHEQFVARCTLDADTERERNVTVMALYQKKAYYIFSAEKEKCAVINLDGEFSEWGVPSDAKNTDDFHYGTATESLNVDEFDKEIECKNHTIYWGIDVTSELCVPVTEDSAAKGRDGPFAINNVFFYDIEPKVEAKFFVPPSYCPGGVTTTKDSPEIQELRERLSFSRAMKLI